MKGLTLHIQSEVGCSPPCLIVAHHLVHSTVTPGGAGDGDGDDRGGCPTTTGDDLSISGPDLPTQWWIGLEGGCMLVGLRRESQTQLTIVRNSNQSSSFQVATLHFLVTSH